MPKFSFIVVVATLSACSSGGAGSVDLGGTNSGGGTACEKAKKVVDDCNASRPADSGVTVNFNLEKCQSGGAQAEAAAQCVVNNAANCDCVLPCAIQGSCS